MPGKFVRTGGYVDTWDRVRWKPGYILIFFGKLGEDPREELRFPNEHQLLTAWEMLGKDRWHPYQLTDTYAWARWKEDNEREE